LEEGEAEDQSGKDDVETGRNLLLAVSSVLGYAEMKQKREKGLSLPIACECCLPYALDIHSWRNRQAQYLNGKVIG
jgi:hypothetical protein